MALANRPRSYVAVEEDGDLRVPGGPVSAGGPGAEQVGNDDARLSEDRRHELVRALHVRPV